MEACLDILQEAKRIFHSIDKEEVLKKVINDPRGISYLEGKRSSNTFSIKILYYYDPN